VISIHRPFLPNLPLIYDIYGRFVFGDDCGAVKEGRVATVQTISGTGANRVGGEFFERFLGSF